MNTSNPKIVIAGGCVLGAAVVTLGALLWRNNSEMKEMTQFFSEERDSLVSEYQGLYTEYDEIRSDNDSLNGLLEEQRERVAQLADELQTLRASNAHRIRELQAELTTLRTVMRSFVVQIDSLSRTNTKLKEENADMRGKLSAITSEKAALQTKADELEGSMRIAARLEAKDVVVTALNHRDKETSRLAQVTKIRTAFTIAKNVSATVGMKKVYVRISRPDGELLMHSATATFTYEDQQLNYSDVREVEYGGQDLSSYVIYTVDSGELMPGTYSVELFCDGERMGASSFKL